MEFKVGDKVQLASDPNDSIKPGVVQNVGNYIHVLWEGNRNSMEYNAVDLRKVGTPTDMTLQEAIDFLRSTNNPTTAYFLEQENIRRKTLQDPDYQLYLKLHERFKGVNNG